jgi:hypothetical protein
VPWAWKKQALRGKELTARYEEKIVAALVVSPRKRSGNSGALGLRQIAVGDSVPKPSHSSLFQLRKSGRIRPTVATTQAIILYSGYDIGTFSRRSELLANYYFLFASIFFDTGADAECVCLQCRNLPWERRPPALGQQWAY